jgi:hypothetical protein
MSSTPTPCLTQAPPPHLQTHKMFIAFIFILTHSQAAALKLTKRNQLEWHIGRIITRNTFTDTEIFMSILVLL